MVPPSVPFLVQELQGANQSDQTNEASLDDEENAEKSFEEKSVEDEQKIIDELLSLIKQRKQREKEKNGNKFDQLRRNKKQNGEKKRKNNGMNYKGGYGENDGKKFKGGYRGGYQGHYKTNFRGSYGGVNGENYGRNIQQSYDGG